MLQSYGVTELRSYGVTELGVTELGNFDLHVLSHSSLVILLKERKEKLWGKCPLYHATYCIFERRARYLEEHGPWLSNKWFFLIIIHSFFRIQTKCFVFGKVYISGHNSLQSVLRIGEPLIFGTLNFPLIIILWLGETVP